jgi:uncharacterized protein YjaG (DUF416 family)
MIRFQQQLQNGKVVKTATVINLSVWDTTLVEEARKWIRSQLQKKRRVFQNMDDATDFSLFATNVPSLDKLKLLIPTKFKTFKDVPKLKEIVNADEFESPSIDLDTEEADDEGTEVSAYYDESSVRPRR